VINWGKALENKTIKKYTADAGPGHFLYHSTNNFGVDSRLSLLVIAYLTRILEIITLKPGIFMKFIF
jgi:hypothetical protein